MLINARKMLTGSFQALLAHLDAGLVQDTALPGTSAAEATRLMKNGLAVTSFACYEHFLRERIHELLREISDSSDRPPFDALPDGLQLAATRGTIEAVRFRLSIRGEGMSLQDMVEAAQVHAGHVASSKNGDYAFSPWSFGHSSSNVGAGTLQEFLVAIGAPKFYAQIRDVLEEVGFDYAAAGLTDGAKFKLSRLSNWRHEAAHDATLSLDVALLRTRITAYAAIAFSFDFLASLAVRILTDGFGAYGPTEPDRECVVIQQLVPKADQFELQSLNGVAVRDFYSTAHCENELSTKATPLGGAVVVRDGQSQLVDWFFY